MPQKRQTSSTEEHEIAVRSLALDYPSGYKLDFHSHGWHQLIYAFSGALTVHTESCFWVIPNNRGVWVPADVSHSLEMSGAVALRTLYLPKDLPVTIGECHAVNIAPFLQAIIMHVIQLGYLLKSEPTHQRLVGVLMDQIQQLDRVPLQLPRPKDQRALRLARYLLNHNGDTRPIAQLCSLTGASQRTLERLFIKETGMTCGRWRQQSRLLTALSLLADGTSVTEISLSMGYQNTSAFIAMFKSAMGITPGKYLQNAKKT